MTADSAHMGMLPSATSSRLHGYEATASMGGHLGKGYG